MEELKLIFRRKPLANHVEKSLVFPRDSFFISYVYGKQCKLQVMVVDVFL